ncbi:MAG: fumarylacetoacetate hydrolase family protein [Oscillospiraceae bacterium]|nr:fumarylacetoacetate hydrolase family protein [Oscillospiraceae bacterium]
MKLLNFLVRGETRVGAVSPRGVIDLFSAGLTSPMATLIAEWETAGDIVRSILADETLPALPMDGLTFAPATRPSKILCVGLNYRDHAAETHGETPKEPAIFCKMPSCAAGHLEEIPLPPVLTKLDHEAELVIIVGKYAYNISAEEAPAHIFGYTCGNDVSARDAQFRSTQWLIGKSLPKFAPSGPVIVTRDELDPSDLAITCAVNGEVRQSARTSDMTFQPPEIVAYASQFIELCPGDQIFTGTPAGVIVGKPKGERVWLGAGDTMTVTIEGIGSLTNRFAAV